MIQYLIYLI